MPNMPTPYDKEIKLRRALSLPTKGEEARELFLTTLRTGYLRGYQDAQAEAQAEALKAARGNLHERADAGFDEAAFERGD